MPMISLDRYIGATTAPSSVSVISVGSAPGVRQHGGQEDVQRRLEALLGAKLGELDAEETPEGLLGVLTSDDTEMRLSEMFAIGRRGSAAGTAVLVATLSDEDPRVRRIAATNLGEITDSPAVVPALVGALQDEDALVRGTAGGSLIALSNPECVSVVMRLLDSEEEAVAGEAARVLGRLRSNAPGVVPALLANLGRLDEARLALVQFGAPAIMGLVAALDSADEQVRVAAIDALGTIHSRAGARVPRPAHEAPGRVSRSFAASSPDWIGVQLPSLPDSLSALLHAQSDPSTDVRVQLAQALYQAGLQADEPAVVPALLAMLDDEGDGVRDQALRSLEVLGWAGIRNGWKPALAEALAEQATPRLLRLMETLAGHDHQTADLVGSALIGLGATAASSLVEALASRNYQTRFQAARALHFLPVDSIPVLDIAPALIAALEEDSPVRAYAAATLRFMGPEVARLVPERWQETVAEAWIDTRGGCDVLG